ncbi:MAG: rhomboid family intramembrane serine protease [Armatimonadetes bacterium]|nr:rhomboid family intramembrane serine protease [Armatimonadota bacterium]
MILIFPVGLTERPKRLPLTIVSFTLAVATMFLAQFVFLSRQEFAPTAKEIWFEMFGYDPEKPNWWSAFTGLLVHANFSHFAVNLLGLWLFGWFVELEMGWKRFLAFASLAHFVALKAQTWFWLWQGQFEPPILVGSSAIVAFCAGAFCIRFRNVGVKWLMFYGRHWRKREFTTPVWWLAAFWLAGQFALLSYGADKTAIAHIASFAIGILTAFGFNWHNQAKLEQLERKAMKAESERHWLEAAEFWSQLAKLKTKEIFAFLAAARNFLAGGNLAMAERNFQEAIKHFLWDEKAIQEACKIALMDEVQNLSAEIVFTLAEQLERHRCYREALRLFQLSSEALDFPKSPQALLKAAELFWRLGYEDKASQCLHLFWLKYSQTHWRQEASSLAAQFRKRGER